MYCLCGCGQEVQAERKSRKFCNDAHKQAYWRRQHQQDQAQGSTFTEMLSELVELREKCHDQAHAIAELEQEVLRLRNLVDIEKRYHQDTTARGLKAWLKKQQASPLGQKLLADTFLPVRGSRGLYEAHLRKNGYTPEEMQEFAHLWKAMLLS